MPRHMVNAVRIDENEVAELPQSGWVRMGEDVTHEQPQYANQWITGTISNVRVHNTPLNLGLNLHERIERSVSEDMPTMNFESLFEGVFGRNGARETRERNTEYHRVNSYNYIPEHFFMNRIKDEEELYLGAEIEIDDGGENDETANMIVNMLKPHNAYIKHDGSLQNGFEIVTHPCTFEYHSTLPYKKLFAKLTSMGYRADQTSTCGLHIHFSKSYLGDNKLVQDLNISKFLYLFEKFFDKISVIARRRENRYAQRMFIEGDETPLDMYAKSKAQGKYCAINLEHENTCEIRIFKGTLNYDTFMATLMFVRDIVMFIKDVDIYNIQNITWDNIKQKLGEEVQVYIMEREEKIAEREREQATAWEVAHNRVSPRINSRRASGDVYYYSDSSGMYQQATPPIPMPNIDDRNLSPTEREYEYILERIDFVENEIDGIEEAISHTRSPQRQREMRNTLQEYRDSLRELSDRSALLWGRIRGEELSRAEELADARNIIAGYCGSDLTYPDPTDPAGSEEQIDQMLSCDPTDTSLNNITGFNIE